MMTHKYGRRGGLGAAALLLFGATVFASGLDFNLGDDLIGTLPVVYPETPEAGLTSGQQGLEGTDSGSPLSPESSFTLYGGVEDLERVLEDAYGAGWVEVETTDDPRVFELVFHGDFNLALDRELVERSGLDLGLRIGLYDIGGVGSVTWKDNVVSSFVIGGGEMDLPLRRLLLTGALDQAPVSALLQGRDGGANYIDLSADSEQVFISRLSY